MAGTQQESGQLGIAISACKLNSDVRIPIRPIQKLCLPKAKELLLSFGKESWCQSQTDPSDTGSCTVGWVPLFYALPEHERTELCSEV